MTERWKPEEGERYYFIGADGKPGRTVFYEGFESDSQAWALGNCFKTEAEAQVAAEKVKALLLSLQDNGNNPANNSPDKDLPEWVEIGGYVYAPQNGYGKVISGAVNYCFVEFCGGAGNFAAEDFSEFKQARLRPYNAEEMKALVGKVLETKRGSAQLITQYIVGVNELCFWGNRLDADALLSEEYIIDGKPAGVFEHLEDGDWIE